MRQAQKIHVRYSDTGSINAQYIFNGFVNICPIEGGLKVVSNNFPSQIAVNTFFMHHKHTHEGMYSFNKYVNSTVPQAHRGYESVAHSHNLHEY